MSRQVAEVPAEAATEATPEAGIEIVVSWDIAKLDSSNSDIRKFDAAFFFGKLMWVNGVEWDWNGQVREHNSINYGVRKL